MNNISKVEVMDHLDKEVLNAIPVFLKSVESIWQPTDFLPLSNEDSFFDEVRELR